LWCPDLGWLCLRDLLAVNTAAAILDTAAILYVAERYAQNAEIAACVSSAHKREVMAHNKVTYLVVIE
jgi:hypothetical protein